MEELELFHLEEDASQTQNFIQVAFTGEELIPKEEKNNLCRWIGKCHKQVCSQTSCVLLKWYSWAEPC